MDTCRTHTTSHPQFQVLPHWIQRQSALPISLPFNLTPSEKIGTLKLCCDFFTPARRRQNHIRHSEESPESQQLITFLPGTPLPSPPPPVLPHSQPNIQIQAIVSPSEGQQTPEEAAVTLTYTLPPWLFYSTRNFSSPSY